MGRHFLLGAGLALLLPHWWGPLLVIGLHIGFLMGAKDVTNTGVGVPWWKATRTLIAIGGHLAITQDFTVTLMNLCVLIIVGSILFRMGGLRPADGFLVIFSGPGVGGT